MTLAELSLRVKQQLPDITDRRAVRVLQLVNGEHFAGAERVQSHLGRCLPALGIRSDFACLKPGRFADAVDAAGGSWGTGYRFGMKNRFDLSVLAAVLNKVREGGYDLMHAHTPRTAMIAAMLHARTNIPWVYHVHSPAARDCSQRLRNWFNSSIERVALRTCSHLITVSDSLRCELLSQGCSEERITVVRNGVPGIRYQHSHEPRPRGRWTFGMVALMRPRKGLEIALQAISILRAAGYDAVLRCIGPFESADYQRAIEAQFELLGIGDSVLHMGFQSDVPRALSQLDALLLPSLYGEGLPMVVLEAMAAALPVIASKVEGTPEAIRDGVDGLLARPGSADSLAEQMRYLMDGIVDWKQMGETAFQRHADLFSDVAMSEGVAKVYRRVLR